VIGILGRREPSTRRNEALRPGKLLFSASKNPSKRFQTIREELTRTDSLLLDSRRGNGPMFKSKTYFEQVPLEIVKQIVEKQIKTEAAGKTAEGIDKEAPNEHRPQAEGRPILKRRTLVKARSIN